MIVLIIVIAAASNSGGEDPAPAASNSTPAAGTADQSPAAAAPQQPASDPDEGAQQPAAAEDGPSAKFPKQDGDWRLESVRLKETFGSFDGTARVTYTGGDETGGDNAFTITVFKKGADVASMSGFANDVRPGKTVTVQLISTDDYVGGPYTYDFQRDW